MDLLQCDVAALPLRDGAATDTVIMNPPFGTRTRGADMAFLRAGFAVSFCCHHYDMFAQTLGRKSPFGTRGADMAFLHAAFAVRSLNLGAGLGLHAPLHCWLYRLCMWLRLSIVLSCVSAGVQGHCLLAAQKFHACPYTKGAHHTTLCAKRHGASVSRMSHGSSMRLCCPQLLRHCRSALLHSSQVAMRELRAKSAEVLAELRYDLPATYAFHRSAACCATISSASTGQFLSTTCTLSRTWFRTGSCRMSAGLQAEMRTWNAERSRETSRWTCGASKLAEGASQNHREQRFRLVTAAGECTGQSETIPGAESFCACSAVQACYLLCSLCNIVNTLLRSKVSEC